MTNYWGEIGDKLVRRETLLGRGGEQVFWCIMDRWCTGFKEERHGHGGITIEWDHERRPILLQLFLNNTYTIMLIIAIAFSTWV